MRQHKGGLASKVRLGSSVVFSDSQGDPSDDANQKRFGSLTALTASPAPAGRWMLAGVMERKSMSDDRIINFAPHQQPPSGYRIEWWECDEHYHWIIDEDNYSQIYSSRWQAWWAAWSHADSGD
jgi:hypothetical protein